MFRLIAVSASSFTFVFCASAENSIFDSAGFYERIANYDNSLIGLVAPRFMDDETLILEAKMRRDENMSNEHRIINSLWLAEGHYGNAHTHALKKMMRSSLKNYFRINRSETSQLNPEQGQPRFIMTDVDKYRLRISGERFILQFKHKF